MGNPSRWNGHSQQSVCADAFRAAHRLARNRDQLWRHSDLIVTLWVWFHGITVTSPQKGSPKSNVKRLTVGGPLLGAYNPGPHDGCHSSGKQKVSMGSEGVLGGGATILDCHSTHGIPVAENT